VSAPRPRDLAELVRAPAALSVPGDVLAGAVAAGEPVRRALPLALASVCLYWAGMAANDWADRDLDAVQRPRRPIPSGRVPAPVALGLAGGLTLAGLAIAGGCGGRRALAVAGALAGTVWAYDLWGKDTVAAPVAMAACRGLDVALGAGGLGRGGVRAALTVAAHTYTVTALSRSESDGGVAALPATTLAGTALVAAVAAAPRQPLGRALAGCYLAWYGGAQARAVARPDAARVGAAVGTGIVGLPVLQAALICGSGRVRLGALVAAAAPVGRALARRMGVT
jgi:hypothetical protein